ncbi:hypothetical protein PsYK624_096130 [Phanerochaete sordida]|uniref:Uncharacterized protein n=1 Tax=Phanerochaete sordida TaxID=48140 RepID=A0A9P3GGZ0_9APHY|nr:hypothetical protein PsYK624_096130 [Phanerochaete sordida]
MGSICLSLAPNLRCQGLTSQEAIALIVPPALELIFCVGLFGVKRGLGLRKEYLLSTEGILYFLLALADLLSHRLPQVTDSLSRFKALDIFIGISSTVPLTFYLSFLFILASKDFVPNLPLRLQAVTKYALLCIVPMVLAFNLLGSFATLTYRFVHPKPNSSEIGVKYADATLELFFNSLTLVLLVIFQAVTFSTCFYRLIQALLDQRRIDVTANGNDHERHFINGTGWIALGVKLGALESIIGFASGDFGLTLTRRILRFLGRACLIIGAIKGIDAVEDFHFIKREPKSRPMRKSALRALISSPNPATFHQIGGYDYEPSIAPPAAVSRSRTITMRSSMAVSPVVSSIQQAITPRQSFLSMSQDLTTPSRSVYSGTATPSRYTAATTGSAQPQTPVQAPDSRSASPDKPPRVIVRHRHGRAPTLDFNRFSDLGLPGSEARNRSLDSPKLRYDALPPEGTTADPFAADPSPALRGFVFPPPPLPALPTQARTRHTIGVPRHDAPARAAARQSSQTFVGTDTLGTLHALAMESPRTLPDTAFARLPREPAPSIAESDNQTVVGAASLARTASERTVASTTTLVRRGSSTKRKPVPKYEEDVDPVPAVVSEKETEEVVEVVEAAPEAPKAIVSGAKAGKGLATLPSDPRPKGRRRPARTSTQSAPDLSAAGAPVAPLPSPRIKSIGRAPRKWTPTPSQSEAVRASVVAEWHEGDQGIYPTPPGSAGVAV